MPHSASSRGGFFRRRYFLDADFADYAEGFWSACVLRQDLFSKRAFAKGRCLVRRIPSDFVIKPTK
jgi:hypothetical protein